MFVVNSITEVLDIDKISSYNQINIFDVFLKVYCKRFYKVRMPLNVIGSEGIKRSFHHLCDANVTIKEDLK